MPTLRRPPSAGTQRSAESSLQTPMPVPEQHWHNDVEEDSQDR